MITIRPAKTGDETGIAGVHVRSYTNAYQGILDDSMLEAISLDKRKIFWEDIINKIEQSQMSAGVFVATIEDSDSGSYGIVGFLSVSAPVNENANDPGLGEITALYVDPDFQKRRAGEQLLVHGLEWLQNHGFKTAFVKVLEDNKYKKFYLKNCGILQTDKTKSVERGSKILNLVEYQWEL